MAGLVTGQRMDRIQRYFGSEDPHPPEKLKFDNTYTFDKVTNVYNGGVIHEENQPAHLLILDTEVCITRCTEEFGNPCFHFCPAQVYEVPEGATVEASWRCLRVVGPLDLALNLRVQVGASSANFRSRVADLDADGQSENIDERINFPFH